MPKPHRLVSRTLLVSTLGLAALALGARSVAESAPAGAAAERSALQGDEDSPLAQAMQAMQAAQKRLEGALEKKDLKAALPLVVDMQRAALAAKVETPPTAAEIGNEKKKAEFVNGFRKQIIALEKSLRDLEVAVLDGKSDDALRINETVIKPSKKEGHAKYKGD
jgi:hypothetical protein